MTEEREFVGDEKPILKCGCAANSTFTFKDGTQVPGCVVHDETEPAEGRIDLTGRVAECPHCRKRVPSERSLWFFSYRGPGSPCATEQCVCGYFRVAHEKPDWLAREKARVKCKGVFTPHGPWKTDLYYDGCRGTD